MDIYEGKIKENLDLKSSQVDNKIFQSYTRQR